MQNCISLAISSYAVKYCISSFDHLRLSDSEQKDIETLKSLLPSVLRLSKPKLAHARDPQSLVLQIRSKGFSVSTMTSLITRLGHELYGEVMQDNKGSEYLTDADIAAMSKEERYDMVKAFFFVLLEAIVSNGVVLTDEEKSIFTMIIESLYKSCKEINCFLRFLE